MDSTDSSTDETKKYADPNEVLQTEQEIEYFLGVFTDIMTDAAKDVDVQQVGLHPSQMKFINFGL